MGASSGLAVRRLECSMRNQAVVSDFSFGKACAVRVASRGGGSLTYTLQDNGQELFEDNPS